MPCRMIMGATMMISERPNMRRGIIRLMARKGCSAKRNGRSRSRSATPARRAVARAAGEGWVLSDAIWDKDITRTAHRLNVQRKLGILLDFAPQPCHLDIHRPLQPQIEFFAQRRAGKRPARIGRKQFQKLLF